MGNPKHAQLVVSGFSIENLGIPLPHLELGDRVSITHPDEPGIVHINGDGPVDRFRRWSCGVEHMSENRIPAHTSPLVFGKASYAQIFRRIPVATEEGNTLGPGMRRRISR